MPGLRKPKVADPIGGLRHLTDIPGNRTPAPPLFNAFLFTEKMVNFTAKWTIQQVGCGKSYL